MNATPEQFAAELAAKFETQRGVLGKLPTRLIGQVHQLGAVGAAKALVAKGTQVQETLTELAARDRLDLAVERLMQLPPYRHLFTRLELQEAERRAGPPPTPTRAAR